MVKVPELASLDETRAAALHVFETYLRLFHPLIPFVTEEIWGCLDRPGQLIRAAWPVASLHEAWSEDVDGVDAVLRLVVALRRLRADARVEPKAKVAAFLRPLAFAATMRQCEPVVRRLANLEALTWDGEAPAGAVMAVDPAFQVAVDLGEANREAERQKLRGELEGAERRLQKLQGQLANEAFVSNAKPEVVEKARADERELRDFLVTLRQRLGDLGG